MLEAPTVGLRTVSADDLAEDVRACLRPGELAETADGLEHRLPTYFYEIPSWEATRETKLAPDFGLWEMIDVDVREAEAMRLYPRYVPCALAVVAGYLQLLRNEIGRVVRVA
ncbi:MAG TPA: hypothetical protein VMN39_07025, partial [Longimicrobiaceae bacterium]|nr:hypothetical protein [Longimicrobiaceae bacterium]